MERTCSRHVPHISALAMALLGTIAVVPARATDVAPYDLGYAKRAGEVCQDLTFAAELTDWQLSHPEFMRGAGVVDQYLESLPAERVCVLARKLYDVEVGKAAKLLKKQ